MKKCISVLLIFLMLSSAAQAGRDILIVTPAGVFLVKMVKGVPQPPVAQELDVIVQDFVPGGPVPPVDDPIPPADDPIVVQIAAISKATLKDSAEGTAVAAVVSSLAKLNLTGTNFKEALLLAAPIADTSLKANGRINKWVKDALVVVPMQKIATESPDDFNKRVTADIARLKAGLVSAFGIAPATLDTIHEAAMAGPTAELNAEALNWAQIIEIIQLIIQLLRNLGIIPA